MARRDRPRPPPDGADTADDPPVTGADADRPTRAQWLLWFSSIALLVAWIVCLAAIALCT